MKRLIVSLLCAALILALAACSDSSSKSRSAGQPAGVNDVLAQGVAAQNAQASSTPTSPAASQQPNKAVSGANDIKKAQASSIDAASQIDIDLTALSSVLVYSEVYNMMLSPEKYVGKTVKMHGPFSYFLDEATGKYYFACIIEDATACCAQGLEFELKENLVFPEDYPAVGEDICVIGVFDTYQEGGYTYCTLRNASLSQL